ncbi:MAG: twin-arginine translocation signal domain-containing protein [Acidimicrobiales bacterium]
MSEISRRTFLKQGGVAAAAAGAMAVVPKKLSGKGASSARQRSNVVKPGAGAKTRGLEGEALIVHVPDVTKSEAHLLVGTREITVHDPELVHRLNRAAS